MNMATLEACAPNREGVGLSERREAVLRVVVEDYMSSAKPVGSASITSRFGKFGFKTSSATVRKEMRSLEDAGYLSQPHISAGRVPTEMGYRYFIDALMGPCVLERQAEHTICDFFGNASRELDRNLMDTSQLLSEVTHCASVVLPPSSESATLRSLQLVRMEPQIVLLIVVLSNGVVEKRAVEFEEAVSEHELGESTRLISEAAVGETPPFSEADVPPCPQSVSHIVAPSWEALCGAVAEAPGYMFVGGTSELAGVFETIDTLREILSTLEQKYVVVTLLRDLVERPAEHSSDSTPDLGAANRAANRAASGAASGAANRAADRGVQVSIGAENMLPPLRQCSLVVAPYASSESDWGSLAVIGPTHMDYPQAMAAVGAVSSQLSGLLCES